MISVITKNLFIKDSSLLLSLCSLIYTFFYIFCSTPTCGWRDGPEFAVTATFLDIAHPAGFPTYNLLANIFTWLPFASLGFRVTLFTAVVGGISIYLFGLLVLKLFNLDFFDKNKLESFLWLFISISFFALHKGVWAASVELEVYSLNLMFLILLLYCATSWYSGKGIGWLYFGGFLYGLACGNHAALSLYLPVLLLLTIWGDPKHNSGIRYSLTRISILSVLFLIGLSVYLLLIIRSQTDILPIDFGRTNTWQRVWYHISDKKDSSDRFVGLVDLQTILVYLKMQFFKLTSGYIWVGIPVSLIGIGFLWKKYQIMVVALILLILINIIFFFYWIDGVAAFMPTILVFFIFFSLGTGVVCNTIRSLSKKKKIFCLYSIGLLVLICLFNMGTQRVIERDAQIGYLSTDFFWTDWTNFPPESLVLAESSWFSHMALQQIYVVRPDVSLIFLTGLMSPVFLPPPIPSKFPMAIFPKDNNGNFLLPETEDYYEKFLNANIQENKPIYVEFTDSGEGLLEYVDPDPQIMWFAKFTAVSALNNVQLDKNRFKSQLSRIDKYIYQVSISPQYAISAKAPAYIYYLSKGIYEYLNSYNQYENVANSMILFLEGLANHEKDWVIPFDVQLSMRANCVQALRMTGRYGNAEKIALQLVKLNPAKASNWYLLGTVYHAWGRGEEAIAALKKSLDLDPLQLYVISLYMRSLAQFRSINSSLDEMNIFVKLLKAQELNNTANLTAYLMNCLILAPEDMFLTTKDIYGVPNF